MRQDLSPLIGIRWRVRGRFVKFGVHRYRHRPEVGAVYLEDIRVGKEPLMRSGRANSSAEFAALGLKPGDWVEFDARLERSGWLTRPAKVMRIADPAAAEDAPLFAGVNH